MWNYLFSKNAIENENDTNCPKAPAVPQKFETKKSDIAMNCVRHYHSRRNKLLKHFENYLIEKIKSNVLKDAKEYGSYYFKYSIIKLKNESDEFKDEFNSENLQTLKTAEINSLYQSLETYFISKGFYIKSLATKKYDFHLSISDSSKDEGDEFFKQVLTNIDDYKEQRKFSIEQFIKDAKNYIIDYVYGQARQLGVNECSVNIISIKESLRNWDEVFQKKNKLTKSELSSIFDTLVEFLQNEKFRVNTNYTVNNKMNIHWPKPTNQWYFNEEEKCWMKNV